MKIAELILNEGFTELKDPKTKEVKASVDTQYDRADGEMQVHIWIKCDSAKEFDEIINDNNHEITKFVERNLNKKHISLMDLDDRKNPYAEDGGYGMWARVYM